MAEYNGKDKIDNNICRDFLRNVCRRGSRCKYRHPEENEARTNIKELVFCHDYQNHGCERNNCKFLHCTKLEEEYFHGTGDLPSQVKREAASSGGSSESVLPIISGDIPVCKDFLKGDCHRGQRCKYRHVDPNGRPPVTFRQDPRPTTGRFYPPSLDDDTRDMRGSSLKRRHLEDDPYGLDSDRYGNMKSEPAFQIDDVPIEYRLLQDENLMLRRKMEDLKKQIRDLSATNEVLLEQNARLRTNKMGNHFVGNSAAVVSVTPSMTPIVTPAIITPGTPLNAAHRLTMDALTTNLSQQAQALQQQLSDLQATPQIAAGLVATAPGLNPPVSLTMGSLAQATLGSVTLAQTMPPESLPSVSMQQNMATDNMSQGLLSQVAMSRSNAQGLVSYPVASQSYSQPTH